VVIIQVVIVYLFCVDVKSFDRIQVGSFSVAVQYLRDFVHRAEGVC
jgi:hypothetical protein